MKTSEAERILPGEVRIPGIQGTDGRVPGLATRRPADVQKSMRLHRWQSSWPRNSPTRRCAESDAPPPMAEFLASQLADPQMCRNRCASYVGLWEFRSSKALNECRLRLWLATRSVPRR